MREAAKEKAEAEKILQVKAAEAEAEAKYLLGAGVAKQRKAIVDGLRETVTDFSEEVEGATPKDVMDLLLMTQYFDTLKNMGAAGEGSSGTLSFLTVLTPLATFDPSSAHLPMRARKANRR